MLRKPSKLSTVTTHIQWPFIIYYASQNSYSKPMIQEELWLKMGEHANIVHECSPKFLIELELMFVQSESPLKNIGCIPLRVQRQQSITLYDDHCKASEQFNI